MDSTMTDLLSVYYDYVGCHAPSPKYLTLYSLAILIVVRIGIYARQSE